MSILGCALPAVLLLLQIGAGSRENHYERDVPSTPSPQGHSLARGQVYDSSARHPSTQGHPSRSERRVEFWRPVLGRGSYPPSSGSSQRVPEMASSAETLLSPDSASSTMAHTQHSPSASQTTGPRTDSSMDASTCPSWMDSTVVRFPSPGYSDHSGPSRSSQQPELRFGSGDSGAYPEGLGSAPHNAPAEAGLESNVQPPSSPAPCSSTVNVYSVVSPYSIYTSVIHNIILSLLGFNNSHLLVVEQSQNIMCGDVETIKWLSYSLSKIIEDGNALQSRLANNLGARATPGPPGEAEGAHPAGLLYASIGPRGEEAVTNLLLSNFIPDLCEGITTLVQNTYVNAYLCHLGELKQLLLNNSSRAWVAGDLPLMGIDAWLHLLNQLTGSALLNNKTQFIKMLCDFELFTISFKHQIQQNNAASLSTISTNELVLRLCNRILTNLAKYRENRSATAYAATYIRDRAISRMSLSEAGPVDAQRVLSAEMRIDIANEIGTLVRDLQELQSNLALLQSVLN